jgi:hypothetical protein
LFLYFAYKVDAEENRRDTRVDGFELMDAGIKRREGRANEDQIEDLSSRLIKAIELQLFTVVNFVTLDFRVIESSNP